MPKENNFNEKKKRADRVIRVLKRLYPSPKIALNYRTPWELLVAVMLSAQCTDKRVNMVTRSLFRKYRGIRSYALADRRDFEQSIFSTGFFRHKAQNIISTARILCEKHSSRVPSTLAELEALPGVGRKTALVVLFHAFGKIEGIAVDTHVKRFARKLELSQSNNPVQVERDLKELFPKDEWGLLTLRFIQYGREICHARPHPDTCMNHPLTRLYPPAAKIWPRTR